MIGAAPSSDSSLLIFPLLFPDETTRVAADLGLAAFRHGGGDLPKPREVVDGNAARARIFWALHALDLHLGQETTGIRRARQRSVVRAGAAPAGDPAVFGRLVRIAQRDRRARGRVVHGSGRRSVVVEPIFDEKQAHANDRRDYRAY